MKHPDTTDPAKHLRELTKQLEALAKTGQAKFNAMEARAPKGEICPQKPLR